MKKIVTILTGGIGNQMFQYSFGKMIAERNNAELCLDTTFYLDSPDRAVGIDKYDVSFKEMKPYPFYNWLRLKCQRIPVLRWIAGTYKERWLFDVDPNVFRFKYRVYMGFWQNLRYLEESRNTLLKEFCFEDNLSDSQKTFLDEIKTSNSIAAHIRHGDYLSERYNSMYCVADADYYACAIKLARKELDDSDAPVYFFSDDIQWCRETFSQLNNVHFVDHEISDSQYVDLELMKNAKVNINANSTFSWWAAWLNQRENHKTYVPFDWYKDPKLNERAKKAIIPTEWVIVERNN